MSLAFIFRIHSAGWLYLLLSLFEWTTNTFWGTDHWSVLDQIVCGLVSWWKLVLVNNRTTGFESMHYYSPIQYMSSVYMYVSIIIFFSFYLGCLVCIRISYCAGQNAKIFFPVFHSAAHIHLNSFFFFFLYHYVCGNCNHPPTFQLPRLMEGHQSVYWAASPGLLFSSLTTPELIHGASRPHIKDRLATALGYYASLLKEHKSNEILNGIILACARASVCACVKHRERHHMLLPRILCAVFIELLVNWRVKQHAEDEQCWALPPWHPLPTCAFSDWLSVH